MATNLCDHIHKATHDQSWKFRNLAELAELALTWVVADVVEYHLSLKLDQYSEAVKKRDEGGRRRRMRRRRRRRKGKRQGRRKRRIPGEGGVLLVWSSVSWTDRYMDETKNIRID